MTDSGVEIIMAHLGNVFILGDSYSTFEGFIPDWCEPYYTKKPGKDIEVNDVSQTWWYKLLEETQSCLVRNCSYSGTTICNTGYDGEDCSHKSFIARLDRLIAEGFFNTNNVNTFFVFGGTNDSWAGSPIGEPKYMDWSKEDLYMTMPAFCYLLHRISEDIPCARVVCIINTELNLQIQKGLKNACEMYKVESIQLNDIDKYNGHPTIKGMEQIKEQIKNHFDFNNQ